MNNLKKAQRFFEVPHPNKTLFSKAYVIYDFFLVWLLNSIEKHTTAFSKENCEVNKNRKTYL